MEICNHYINKNLIAGIGPLIIVTSGGAEQMKVITDSRQLIFELHLKNHTIKIESDWLALDKMSDRDGTNEKRYEDFVDRYIKAAEEIKKIIDGEENKNKSE